MKAVDLGAFRFSFLDVLVKKTCSRQEMATIKVEQHAEDPDVVILESDGEKTKFLFHVLFVSSNSRGSSSLSAVGGKSFGLKNMPRYGIVLFWGIGLGCSNQSQTNYDSSVRQFWNVRLVSPFVRNRSRDWS